MFVLVSVDEQMSVAVFVCLAAFATMSCHCVREICMCVSVFASTSFIYDSLSVSAKCLPVFVSVDV